MTAENFEFRGALELLSKTGSAGRNLKLDESCISNPKPEISDWTVRAARCLDAGTAKTIAGVQSQISGFGFEMQDSSNFQIPSEREVPKPEKLEAFPMDHTVEGPLRDRLAKFSPFGWRPGTDGVKPVGIITVTQAALRLGVTKSDVLQLIRSNQLKARHIRSSQWIIETESVDALKVAAAAKKQKPRP